MDVGQAAHRQVVCWSRSCLVRLDNTDSTNAYPRVETGIAEHRIQKSSTGRAKA